MARNTAIRGLQIQDAFFGDGLKRNSGDNNIAEIALGDNSALSFTDSKLEATAGDGINTYQNVSVDFATIAHQGINVADDDIAFVDADNDTTRKDSIADLVTAMAGSGLTATNGVLSADTITDNLVESDIKFEDESASCDDVTTDFTLDSSPVTSSVQVYLNGLIQQVGSGKDYTLDGTTVSFATAPATGDLLLIHYIANN